MTTLVLGGVRSGKSEIAERILTQRSGPLVYAATADAGDESLAERVRQHQDRRGRRWHTAQIEPGTALGDLIASESRPLLVDSLGVWLARHRDFVVDLSGIVSAVAARTGPIVLVSDEVGLSVHPATDVGRRFQDALGTLNRAVAEVADHVYLVAAGHLSVLVKPDDLFGPNFQ